MRGPTSHGFDRNELLVKKAQWSSDPARLMVVVANYMFGFSFSYCILHLKGEEVSGFAKRPTNYPPNANYDFHRLDHVNFFHP